MPPLPALRPAAGVALLSLVLGACSASAPPSMQAASLDPVRAVPASHTGPVLAPFAGRRVAVWPTQRVAPAGAAAWWPSGGAADSALRTLDDSLSAVLGRRGLDGTWVFADAVERMGRRNASFVSDPRRLTVTVLSSTKRTGDPVSEPLIGQLRALAGVADARFALVPAELVLGTAADGTRRAVLRLALVDVRSTQLLWTGEVASDSTTSWSPALAANVAEHLADLIVPR
ncbi:MAG TPA: hypothetical protein VHQ45_04390 [Gemmatimonadaceae bacterium]|nr:hypothetical protein [Gemmatimonadaceae bacterium]